MSQEKPENLQGWSPPLTNEQEIRAAVETAFDYRGDLTLTLKDGRKIEGYIFDRRADAAGLDQCILRLLIKDSPEKLSVRYDEIDSLTFSGRDTAAGKSFETWVKKYKEKKAAGEKNIQIEPEKLD